MSLRAGSGCLASQMVKLSVLLKSTLSNNNPNTGIISKDANRYKPLSPVEVVIGESSHLWLVFITLS